MPNSHLNAASGGIDHETIRAVSSSLLSPETIDAAAKGALKAGPAGVVTFLYSVLDVPVEKWVSASVLIFTVLQIVVLIRREFIRRKDAK